MYVTTVISKITGSVTHVNSSVGRRKESIEVRLTHALKPPSPASEKKTTLKQKKKGKKDRKRKLVCRVLESTDAGVRDVRCGQVLSGGESKKNRCDRSIPEPLMDLVHHPKNI